MKVLALDIATNTGVAVGDSGGTPKAWSVSLNEGLALKIPGETPQEKKFRMDNGRFSNALRLTHGLIETHKPDFVAIEAAVGGAKASFYLVMLVGCVRGCATNRGVKCETFNIGSVRKHFLGKAYTTRDFPELRPAKAKERIKGLVMDRCRLLGWEVEDDDSADACATWDYACATKVQSYQAPALGGLLRG